MNRDPDEHQTQNELFDDRWSSYGVSVYCDIPCHKRILNYTYDDAF